MAPISKRVKLDPTKGSWWDHEILVMKIYWALERIRFKDALQKLGNVQRYSINQQCTVDQFTLVTEKMKNVVQEREKEIANEKRRIELIYDSVAFFKAKKMNDMCSLDDVIRSVSSIDSNSAVDIPIWKRSVSEFDEEKYLRGEY